MNSLVPIGTQNGVWTWNGTNWVCDPDCPPNGGTLPVPCPPFGPPVFSGPTQQPPWYPGANGGISFGASPPPNPVRGHLFWDGTALWLFDGAAWVAVGGAGASGGTATGSQPPAIPFAGQLWFNGSTLFVWDGNAWVPTSSTRSFVQATAPPAPNPGDLWFDGSVQRIWSGTAWIAVGPGATVGPVPTTTLVFSLTQSGPVATGGATWNIVPFAATPSIDTLGGWNATTHQYLPTKAGNYLVFSRSFKAAAQGSATHAVVKNDNGAFNISSQYYVTIQGITATVDDWLIGTGLVHMNGTTDYIRLWNFSSDGNFDQISYAMPALEAWLLP